ncbi:hypothetical protein CPB84DRAFT_1777514 [Gymnopilus junonius]|uniref:Uncharacterized protein n=1 Tax=Gymnopilus junonius TaxID=109634 RepID=A0A9P5NQB4_GYMJU|nr:hypothetical protein CPB84DRAFT_1777514 [Gymnopilus junonius]
MSHFGCKPGYLRKLKNITIGCRIASGDGIIVPMGISGILSPPTSPSAIQGIEITIDWIDCRIGSEESRLTATAEPAWDILDQTLSRLSTFPDLCRVSLNLKLGYGWSTSPGLPNPPDRIVTVKDHLERLAGRLLPLTSKLLTVKTHINVLVYKSRYASNSAYY